MGQRQEDDGGIPSQSIFRGQVQGEICPWVGEKGIREDWRRSVGTEKGTALV